jgi:putative transposase
VARRRFARRSSYVARLLVGPPHPAATASRSGSTSGSDFVFQAEGIEVIRTPIAAPKANSHMERQIGSTRRECLDWILILNRRHLERVLADWFEHYNAARPHRALGLQPPIARSDPVVTAGEVICTERLGGLLREYAREPLPAAA